MKKIALFSIFAAVSLLSACKEQANKPEVPALTPPDDAIARACRQFDEDGELASVIRGVTLASEGTEGPKGNPVYPVRAVYLAKRVKREWDGPTGLPRGEKLAQFSKQVEMRFFRNEFSEWKFVTTQAPRWTEPDPDPRNASEHLYKAAYTKAYRQVSEDQLDRLLIASIADDKTKGLKISAETMLRASWLKECIRIQSLNSMEVQYADQTGPTESGRKEAARNVSALYDWLSRHNWNPDDTSLATQEDRFESSLFAKIVTRRRDASVNLFTGSASIPTAPPATGKAKNTGTERYLKLSAGSGQSVRENEEADLVVPVKLAEEDSVEVFLRYIEGRWRIVEILYESGQQLRLVFDEMRLADTNQSLVVWVKGFLEAVEARTGNELGLYFADTVEFFGQHQQKRDAVASRLGAVGIPELTKMKLESDPKVQLSSDGPEALVICSFRSPSSTADRGGSVTLDIALDLEGNEPRITALTLARAGAEAKKDR